MPEFADLLYEVDDHIATITLNRPDRLNAISGPMLQSFSEAFREADLDNEVRVIILTGSGDLTPGGAGFSIDLNLLPPGGTPGALFVSLNEANLPFKGGVFDPAPVLAQFALVAPPSGLIVLSSTMPAAVPSGTGFVMQAWFVSTGFSERNASKGTMPKSSSTGA